MNIDDSYEQHLLDGSYGQQQQQQQPIFIPIQCNSSGGDDVPEWAMIEVNGEFLPPLDDGDDDTITAENISENALQMDDPTTVELGAVHFRGKVCTNDD